MATRLILAILYFLEVVTFGLISLSLVIVTSFLPFLTISTTFLLVSTNNLTSLPLLVVLTIPFSATALLGILGVLGVYALVTFTFLLRVLEGLPVPLRFRETSIIAANDPPVFFLVFAPRLRALIISLLFRSYSTPSNLLPLELGRLLTKLSSFTSLRNAAFPLPLVRRITTSDLLSEFSSSISISLSI